MTEGKSHHYPVYSPDGIHWTLGSQAITGYPTADIGNVWRIKVYGHETAGYGPDILHCIPSPFNPVIGGSNGPDPSKEGLEDTIHLVSVLHYKSYYVMLYDYDFWMDYYGYKGPAEIRAQDGRVPPPKTGIFTGDTRLAVNRDGISKFQLVIAHQPVIARGKRGAWDSGFIVMPGPVIHGDKIYLFYTATDEVGAITEPQWSEPDSPFAVRTGLATLRLDGFTDLETKDGLSVGTATTVPIAVTGAQKARLVVNAGHLMAYRDWLQFEILDAATNQPVPGYTKEDSARLAEEGVRVPVEWSGHATLEGVRASRIKLRFYLYGQAKLYSFHFE